MSEPPPDGTPRLVLFLVVDQLRADYVERFRPLFQHGLARLLDESVVFTDAHHDHAWTLTAPGHATLATGKHPMHHGIVGNSWYDRGSGELIESVDDDDHDPDSSPHRLLASTLGDWLKQRYPGGRVFGASSKDRSAILLGGKRADGAFFYDEDEGGRFVISDYYPDTPPPWLEEFHRDRFPNRFFGSSWEMLPAVAEIGAEYGIVPLDRGPMRDQFPHRVGRAGVAPDEEFYEDLYDFTPFLDRYLLELAQTIVREEQLGRDVYPDLLGLSFSGLDAVGHDFGPNSPEMLDTLLRLDEVLGELLEFIDREIGLDNVLVSLSSDHGVSVVPESGHGHELGAQRFGSAETVCLQRAGAELDATFGEADWFESDFYFDRATLAERGVPQSELAAVLKTTLEACAGVTHVWTPAELAADGAVDVPYHRFYRHTYHPERSPDVLVQFDPHVLARTTNSATHGTPYEYDTHVPWLLRLPSQRTGVVDARVHTVDVAPTLAALLGLDPPGDLDGTDRGALLP